MNFKTVSLPSNRTMPALGMGLWDVGKDAGKFHQEVKAIKEAFDIGFRLFDVAQAYGDGMAEEVLGDAFHNRRDEVILSTKFSPISVDVDNLYEDIIKACDKSLLRMKTDYLDSFMLHWPISMTYWGEVIDAFLDLRADGKIREFGVCHILAQDLEEFCKTPGGEQASLSKICTTYCNKKTPSDLYNVCRRRGMPLYYCGKSLVPQCVQNNQSLTTMAAEKGLSVSQLLTAYVLSWKGIGLICEKGTFQENLDKYLAQNAVISDQEFLTISNTLKNLDVMAKSFGEIKSVKPKQSDSCYVYSEMDLYQPTMAC